MKTDVNEAFELIRRGLDMLRIPHYDRSNGTGVLSIAIPFPLSEEDPDPDMVEICVHHEFGVGAIAHVHMRHKYWKEISVLVDDPNEKEES